MPPKRKAPIIEVWQAAIERPAKQQTSASAGLNASPPFAAPATSRPVPSAGLPAASCTYGNLYQGLPTSSSANSSRMPTASDSSPPPGLPTSSSATSSGIPAAADGDLDQGLPTRSSASFTLSDASDGGLPRAPPTRSSARSATAPISAENGPSEQPGARVWGELMAFITTHGLTPDPSKLLGERWPGGLVPRAADIHYDITSSNPPPPTPFLFPVADMMPKGIPDADDLVLALESSATKKLGGLKHLYFEQYSQLRGAPHSPEELLCSWDIQETKPFRQQFPFLLPPFLATRCPRTNPVGSNSFNISPAHTWHEFSVEVTSTVIKTLSGRRVWILYPPTHGDRDQHQAAPPGGFKQWATALDRDCIGAGVLRELIAEKENGGFAAWDGSKAMTVLTEGAGDALYIPAGWWFCGYSIEGGYDTLQWVVPEWGLKEAVGVFTAMLHGADAGQRTGTTDNELARNLREILKAAESALKEQGGGGLEGFGMLRALLSPEVHQPLLVAATDRMRWARCESGWERAAMADQAASSGATPPELHEPAPQLGPTTSAQPDQSTTQTKVEPEDDSVLKYEEDSDPMSEELNF